jgi:hypothetical protein
MKKKPLLGLFLALLFHLLSKAYAVDISWQSPTDGTTLTSQNRPMTSAFFFELGSFQPGFTPTSANTSEWLTRNGSPNWVRASATAHSSVFNGFIGKTFSYTSNTAPFLSTNKAYILGYNGSITSGEWVLLTNPGWFWPTANPDDFFPIPVFWDTTQTGMTAIVGSISLSGAPVTSTIKSQAFTTLQPPGYDYATWRGLFFSTAQLGNTAISGPAADPDADGVRNADEFAFGTSPISALGAATATVSLQPLTAGSTVRYLFASWPRDQRALSATPSYQYSTTLVTNSWSTTTGFTAITPSNTVDTWKVRTTNPINSSQPRAFLRLAGFSTD